MVSVSKGLACDVDFVGMPHFDLATKAAQYKGHGKVARLIHIIRHSKELSVAALTLLYDHMEHDSKDIQRAKSVANVLSTLDKPVKTDWILEKQRLYATEKENLLTLLSKATAEVLATKMAVSWFDVFSHN